jgi:hypothetical protein
MQAAPYCIRSQHRVGFLKQIFVRMYAAIVPGKVQSIGHLREAPQHFLRLGARRQSLQLGMLPPDEADERSDIGPSVLREIRL